MSIGSHSPYDLMNFLSFGFQQDQASQDEGSLCFYEKVIDTKISNSRLIQKGSTVELIPKSLMEVLGEQIITPALEKVSRVASPVIEKMAFLAKGFDRAVSKYFPSLPVAKAGTLPKGMIVYFESECPAGWYEYARLKGKVPVGYSGLFPIGTSGGSPNITINLENIPPHWHYLFNSAQTGSGDLSGSKNYARYKRPPGEFATSQENAYIVGGTTSQADLGQSSTTGGGESIDSMPPYHVLVPCINNQTTFFNGSSSTPLSDAELEETVQQLSYQLNVTSQKTDLLSKDLVNLNSTVVTHIHEVNDQLTAFESEINALTSQVNRTKTVARLLNATVQEISFFQKGFAMILNNSLIKQTLLEVNISALYQSVQTLSRFLNNLTTSESQNISQISARIDSLEKKVDGLKFNYTLNITGVKKDVGIALETSSEASETAQTALALAKQALNQSQTFNQTVLGGGKASEGKSSQNNSQNNAILYAIVGAIGLTNILLIGDLYLRHKGKNNDTEHSKKTTLSTTIPIWGPGTSSHQPLDSRQSQYSIPGFDPSGPSLGIIKESPDIHPAKRHRRDILNSDLFNSQDSGQDSAIELLDSLWGSSELKSKRQYKRRNLTELSPLPKDQSRKPHSILMDMNSPVPRKFTPMDMEKTPVAQENQMIQMFWQDRNFDKMEIHSLERARSSLEVNHGSKEKIDAITKKIEEKQLDLTSKKVAQILHLNDRRKILRTAKDDDGEDSSTSETSPDRSSLAAQDSSGMSKQSKADVRGLKIKIANSSRSDVQLARARSLSSKSRKFSASPVGASPIVGERHLSLAPIAYSQERGRALSEQSGFINEMCQREQKAAKSMTRGMQEAQDRFEEKQLTREGIKKARPPIVSMAGKAKQEESESHESDTLITFDDFTTIDAPEGEMSERR